MKPNWADDQQNISSVVKTLKQSYLICFFMLYIGPPGVFVGFILYICYICFNKVLSVITIMT